MTRIIRWAGRASIRLTACEDGTIMVEVKDHEALEFPAQRPELIHTWKASSDDSGFYNIVGPAALPAAVQAANEALDRALAAEAQAEGAVSQYPEAES